MKTIGELAFASMVESLSIEDSFNQKQARITETEFQDFCKEYVFSALSGKSLGVAFSEKFKITNDLILLLSTSSSYEETVRYIRKSGYIINETEVY